MFLRDVQRRELMTSRCGRHASREARAMLHRANTTRLYPTRIIIDVKWDEGRAASQMSYNVSIKVNRRLRDLFIDKSLTLTAIVVPRPVLLHVVIITLVSLVDLSTIYVDKRPSLYRIQYVDTYVFIWIFLVQVEHRIKVVQLSMFSSGMTCSSSECVMAMEVAGQATI